MSSVSTVAPAEFAAPRDAGWYNHPDVRSTKAVHAATADWFALCNNHVFLDETLRFGLGDVPTRRQCRRAACRKAFEEGITSV